MFVPRFDVREQAREITAKIGTSAAAGFREVGEEGPKSGEANGIDDVPTLARGLDEAGLFEGGQME